MTWVHEGMEVYCWEFVPELPKQVPVICAAGSSARIANVKTGSEKWIDVQYLHTIEETVSLFQDRLAKFI